MEQHFCIIHVNLVNDRICLRLNVNHEIYVHEKKIKYEKNINFDQLLSFWVFNTLKPAFHGMPFDKISITCPKEVVDKLKNLLAICRAKLEATNRFATKMQPLKGKAKDHENIFVYNTDDNHFIYNLYRFFRDQNKNQVFHETMSTGFNPRTRQWEGQSTFPFTLEELFDFIFENKIKKVVAPNHYMIEHYFGVDHIYLISIFKYIGVEYVIFDVDNGDLEPHGYLYKLFFNDKDNLRISTGFMMRNMYRRLDFSNVQFAPTPSSFTLNSQYTINDDYKVLVLSNSRLLNVRHMITPILYLFSHLPEDNVWEHFHMWFHSLRYMLLHTMEFSEFELMTYNSALFTFFFSGLQFLKYVIIGNISKKYEVEIYGDEGWGTTFPEYYQNRRLNRTEIDELVKTKNYLLMPFNFMHSWPTCPGPLLSAVSYNIPFISMPAMVHTDEFKGFKKIEYRSKKEMNDLIGNVKTIFQDTEVLGSIDYYKTKVVEHLTTLSQKIVSHEKSDLIYDEYLHQRTVHHDLVEKKVLAYIDKNEMFLRESFRTIIQKEPLGKAIDISQTPFYHKPYTQRVMKANQTQ